MKKKLKFSLPILFLLLSLGLIFLTFVFSKQSFLLLEIVIVGVLAYIIFSLVHHHFDKSLTSETILEYILIAVLTVVIVLGTFIR